jgi:3-oxoacyl-[acyl-carrier protein] reductase
MEHQTAVVTGSSSGIGRAIALEFARAGANVVVHFSKSTAAAEGVVAEIHALGRRAHSIQADFHTPNQLNTFVNAAWNAFGTVDTWVNNAGADVLTGPAADWSFEKKLEELIEIDMRASVLLARTAGQRMQTAGRGNLLMIGWDLADRGMEGNSGELFSLTKNAIMGFTRSLALSLAPQVRVNCIAPGWIKTAWGETASASWQERVLRETPLHRWGSPEDIARTARFLCSDSAAFLTGQVINVNGGAVR